jgi:hypothetical protein
MSGFESDLAVVETRSTYLDEWEALGYIGTQRAGGELQIPDGRRGSAISSASAAPPATPAASSARCSSSSIDAWRA